VHFFKTDLKNSYKLAWKYIGSISAMGMFMEINTKVLRDIHLNKE